jgi:hypothetical protein
MALTSPVGKQKRGASARWHGKRMIPGLGQELERSERTQGDTVFATCRRLDTKMDTILDTKRVMMDYKEHWRNCPEFWVNSRHIFPRKCSANFIRNLFIWWNYRMGGQNGKTVQVRQLAPFSTASAARVCFVNEQWRYG